MRTDYCKKQNGVTLIETIVFIVVIGITLTAMVSVFTQYLGNSVDPIVQIRALECAQTKLDEITARRFDENSPTGGVPPCGSAESGAVSCAGIVADSGLDDVGDFNGITDSSNPDCTSTVTVVEAGSDLGMVNNQARRITVNTTSRGGGNATLTTYRTNF
ncbi:MAG: prepilin-type N-terminal cleavage/methylation domain-containing protein [Cellvibrionaceae bacterium]